jgi:hypothetical protein
MSWLCDMLGNLLCLVLGHTPKNKNADVLDTCMLCRKSIWKPYPTDRWRIW